jgi:DNA-binding transcriptional MocR family regulator
MSSSWVSAPQLRDRVAATPFLAPVYRDLAERVRLLVVDGRLTHGLRMPSERDLAEILQLSRSTVAAAYTQLRADGYLVARQGSGNFVSVPHSRVVSTHLPGPFGDDDGSIGMTCASGSAPAALAAHFRAAAERLPDLLGGSGYLPDGLEELRIELAAWFTGRGLRTDPDQLIITAGALSALNIVGRCLLSAGDKVLLESPTYSNAIDALRHSGGRTVAYPVSAAGWDTAGFEQALRQNSPALAYLIPEFQNPTGAWMGEDERRGIARSLRRHRTRAIVDETLVELSLDGGSPRTPLAAHLPDAVTIGSASKAFWGGLRIGWIRAPHDLVRPMIETRAAMDLGAAPFEQLVAARLLADRETVLAQQRIRLREQRDHLAQRLAETLPDWQLVLPAGGLTLWISLPDESSSRLAAAAHAHGVVVTPGPRFYVGGGGERNLRLPYTATETVLTEAVERLAAVWADVHRRQGRSAAGSQTMDLIA